MAKDLISRVRIQGMRTIEALNLDVSGLKVLIGDNGTGKSTIVEACELLHKASSQNFMNQFLSEHSGLTAMGSRQMDLGVRIEGNGPVLSYDFSVVRDGMHTVIGGEILQVGLAKGADSSSVIMRDRSSARYLDPVSNKMKEFEGLHPASLLLPILAVNPPFDSVRRARDALGAIEVHVPFDVTSDWVNRSGNRVSELRGSSMLESSEKLDVLGRNLANVYFALRNDYKTSHWNETLDYVRLGLGDDVKDISFKVDPSGGRIAIQAELAGMKTPVPSVFLSDGVLAYLCLVAIARLGRERSLLSFDEPDLHLHPHLLMRVLDFFEALVGEHPVLLATHSDRLLDGLSDPAESAILCELDENRQTVTKRPDKSQLEQWLKRYRGLGDIRAEGHESSVMTREGM